MKSNNIYTVLDSFDDITIPIQTKNKKRKLEKKLRQIERLKKKKVERLSRDEINKIKNQAKIKEQLEEILCPKVYIKPKKKKKKIKSNRQIDLENKLYREKLQREKEERYRRYEEFWNNKFKNYRKWNNEYHKKGKKFNNFDKSIIDACRFMKLDNNTLDLEIVKKTYHKLALIYHPDKGGSHDEMLELSKNYGILKAYLGN